MSIFSRLRARHYVLIIFGLLAVGVLALSALNTLPNVNVGPRVTVECTIGSEKDDFLRNPQVQQILLREYQLEVQPDSMGSIEQVLLSDAQLNELDCLWPSNSSALAIFEQQNPNRSFDDAIIFNSPIILYTWRDVLDGLVMSNVAAQDPDEGYYTADMSVLVREMQAPRPDWYSFNVDLPSDFRIVTSDPTRSNSGNMFYGLFLNMLAGETVATEADLQAHYATIEEYYQKMGFMESSSGFLFDKYITQGMGAYPLIANYESLIIEFSVANQDRLELVQDTLRIVYPEPTVYSSHPLIALTENGERLMLALQDEEIQRIGWEQHGFRSGLPNIVNDPAVLEQVGIAMPSQVTQILNLPQAEALIDMVNCLDDSPECPPAVAQATADAS